MTYLSPDNGNLALKQAIWYLVGVVIIVILFKLKNDYLYRNAWLFYIIGNITESFCDNITQLSPDAQVVKKPPVAFRRRRLPFHIS